MSKGKHAKTGSYAKPKFKRSLLFVLLSVILLSIVFNNLNPNSNAESIAQVNTTENTAMTEATTEVTTEVTTQPEPELEPPNEIEPMEDENLKLLIESKITKYGFNKNNFAFFYYNIDDKKYYFYNEDAYFTAASTIKVPIAMYYYDEINAGDLSLNSKILYAQGCYESGGGSTASLYSVGDYVPLDFLLEQMIVNSDNTAVNILIKNLGYSNARKDITKYTDEVVPEAFYSDNITSAAYGYDVINYLYEHQDSYQKLIEDMKKSSMGMYLKEYITDYDVAHKYGSYGGYVHDYGIVYGEKTYLVGIFTKNITDSDKVIASISLDILNYTLGKLDVSTLAPAEDETNNTNETSGNTTSNETSKSNVESTKNVTNSGNTTSTT